MVAGLGLAQRGPIGPIGLGVDPPAGTGETSDSTGAGPTLDPRGPPVRRARRVGRSTGRARVRLFTEALDAEDRALTGVEVVDDLGAAIEQAMIDSGSRELAVVPDGPYVIPVVG